MDASAVGRPASLGALPATAGERRLAFAAVAVSAVIFVLLVPFAKVQLPQVWAFIPMYQSALMIIDLTTAWLLFAQFWALRSRALLLLACAYVFSALCTAAHTLSFPGLFAEQGLLSAGPQTTAWLYMFWHAGFPALVFGYALLKGRRDRVAMNGAAAIAAAVLGVAAATGAFALLATAGQDALPAIMSGNRTTPMLTAVVSSVWAASMAALAVLWLRRPHSVLDLWLMVVLCAWIFDIGLSAVFNAGRFDLGFYAGRMYGLLAASFVLFVLLVENSRLYTRLASNYRLEALERRRVEQAVTRHEERLRILHEIDRAMATEQPPEAIAAAVIRPLRELLGVPRAIVNRIDVDRGEVEWIAAAGRKQVRLGPGVRYPIGMMGEVAALRRGEPQRVHTRRQPPGPDVDALLASGVEVYLVVPMIAGGELLGAISFGGPGGDFPDEQIAIASEVATQLAIAIQQSRLLARVRQHAAELETRVAERTAALETARRELEDLYDRAPCGYHSVDAEGRIVRINATWLAWLGYAREEVVGRLGHADLMTPESAARFREETFPRFRRDGFLEAAEFEYRRKDGSTFIGQLNATSIYDAQGRFVMSRSTVFDVSARKRSEERLAALNKELESFSYSVSHDLRAPLRAIDGYARMLDEDCGARLGDEGRRLLGVVRSSARRMGRLIDDLLEFSRLGQLEPSRARLDMSALAREAAAELAGEYPRAVVHVGELPGSLADRILLKQVWLNLIDNALKYSARGEAPRVEVTGSADGDRVVYAVRDNGVGFDMRYAAKLFGVFQRLHRQDEFPGTGVGLAIVQRIVSRHGGRVWAEASPGEGACFRFSLPADGPGGKTL